MESLRRLNVFTSSSVTCAAFMAQSSDTVTMPVDQLGTFVADVNGALGWSLMIPQKVVRRS